MKGQSPRGFTLLEMMLVLLLMAVISALVIPNLFSPSSAQLADEGRHLQQVLRLAAEEAQLRGAAIRWSAYHDHYLFEMVDNHRVWRPMTEKPFAQYHLPPTIQIASVQVQDALSLPDTKSKRDAVQGQVIFSPDGTLTVADVVLRSETERLPMQLRPGVNGIRTLKPAP
ncbi:MAG: GspH/FimT family protein [Mariprofundales bacterium]|nr:GspH/FimT family protein [Mariprofundales bacterium]